MDFLNARDSIQRLQVQVDDKLVKVIDTIQASGSMACALVYKNHEFVNLLTDGDVRRALIEYKSLDVSAMEVVKQKLKSDRGLPITASIDSSLSEMRSIFKNHNLRQLLVTDKEGNPLAILTQQDVWATPKKYATLVHALVMAGGFGTRMRPLTNNMPKPMLPVNGVPLLETIVTQLASAGIVKVYISTHYLPNMIVNHFGNGSRFNLEIEYLHETEPMGTGGSLTLLKDKSTDILVINGDIYTNLDLEHFCGYHFQKQADISIATSLHLVSIPFGVVESIGAKVLDIIEKPTSRFLINSGIYVLSPSVLMYLNEMKQFDITELIKQTINRDGAVYQFPMYERWTDIGQIEQYRKAQSVTYE